MPSRFAWSSLCLRLETGGNCTRTVKDGEQATVQLAVTPMYANREEQQMPGRRKSDQSAPRPVSPTGATNGRSPEADPRAQSGKYLTTAQGLRLPDTDHSLKAGARGPTLLEDFHLREKITHFDHERIPERVVHARGAAAHGIFESYGTAASVTKAGFLGKKGTKTEVFTRFSTVLGSRGSADAAGTYSGWVVGNSRIRAVSSDWPAPGTRILHSIGAWPALIDDETVVEHAEIG